MFMPLFFWGSLVPCPGSHFLPVLHFQALAAAAARRERTCHAAGEAHGGPAAGAGHGEDDPGGREDRGAAPDFHQDFAPSFLAVRISTFFFI